MTPLNFARLPNFMPILNNVDGTVPGEWETAHGRQGEGDRDIER